MKMPPNREVSLFSAALELPASQRAAYLSEVCADDPALQQRLEELLGVHEKAISFLESPASGAQASPMGAEGPAGLASPAPEKAGDHIGRYKLLQQIGEGGCGAVYMAEQEEPVHRRVALKIIKLGMDTKAVIARFEAERQALALMDHPNIARVLDAGATDGGRPYFVMELVRGIKITDFCDENCLSTEERLRLFVQVCQAVQHAHQKGIIHRDIKPSNILVTVSEPGAPGCAKIIDFGIAKATTGLQLTDKTLFTVFEHFIGTPAYMSPEQAMMTALDIDTRTDIYSLGVLLYELLTGKTPLDQKELLAAGLDEMRRTIREKEPVRPSTRLSTMLQAELTTTAKHRHSEAPKLIHLVRGDLDWIVMKCLEKDRARRYETANGLANDVQRHLSCEPVEARPPSRLYEFQKTVRRHKFGFAAAAALITALAAGVLVSAWEAMRARQAEREQARLRRRAEEVAVRLELQRAEDWLAADNSAQGLATLSHVLRQYPTNLIAAQRLVSALTHRSFALPRFEPLRHAKSVQSAEFSPSGRQIVTASRDGTARIWDAATGQALGPPLRHSAGVNRVRFSPDGEKVVTCSDDMTARVWDAHSGQALTPPLLHRGRVKIAAFSPDSRLVVTASDDGTAGVWEVRMGKPAFPPLKHDGAVTAVQFSPDGQWVLTASQDGTARLWDARTGGPAVHLFRHRGPVNAAQFSSDGRQIATASADHTGRVWDIQTGQPLTPPLAHQHDLYFIQFSPDGQRVATASLDRTARLWDARTGRPLGQPMLHDDQLSSVQFSPDGLRVVTASEDSTARVWDALTSEPLSEAMRHESKLFSALFSSDGQSVVTASEDSTARVWDARPGRALPRSLKHASFVREAAPSTDAGPDAALDWSAARPAAGQYSPDGKRILTFSGDQTVRIWDAVTGEELTPPLRLDGWVTSAEFKADGKAVLAACADAPPLTWAPRTGGTDDHRARERPAGASVIIWDAQSGQPLAGPLRHAARVSVAHFSRDGVSVVTASWDKTARVWDARTGQPITGSLLHGDGVSSARFSPGGERIVTASGDDTVRVWDAKTGQPLGKPMRHGGWVHDAVFSPDGSRVVSASADNTARVWDARTGEPMTPPLIHQGGLSFALFSPDGLRVATCSWDKTARLWDSQTGRALTEPLRHGAVVHTVDFTTDGQWLVTASDDRCVRLWDCRSGQPVSEPLRGDAAPVSSAYFSPDGLHVVSAPLNGTVRIWETPHFCLPIPAWLPALAEAVVGQRLTEEGGLEIVPVARLFEIKRRVQSASPIDAYDRWAQWFFADRSTRSISPESPMTALAYTEPKAKRDIEESSQEPQLTSRGPALRPLPK
jgi:WD40 repeat protein/serine/threonine protein kinase